MASLRRRRTATGIGNQPSCTDPGGAGKAIWACRCSRFDCYLAVAGRLDVEEPAGGSSVWRGAWSPAFAIWTLPAGTVLVGELGLGGQLRPGRPAGSCGSAEAARPWAFAVPVVPAAVAWESGGFNWGLELLEAGTVAEALWPPWGVESSGRSATHPESRIGTRIRAYDLSLRPLVFS